ncbi:MAG: PAS sensor protein [Alistipes sp.]|nr:PAS sensor protein [Alistipes sp.]
MTTLDFSRWNAELDCAVTVCDTEGTVLYQNRRSREVNGDVRGRSLIPCHNPRSQAIIRRLLDEGGRNVYTIEKHGVRKLIYQTVWRENGMTGGLVEYSMELPEQMPHYVREQ